MDTVEDTPRFQLIQLDPDDGEDDGADVIAGLSAARKWLPCKYFYDGTGSVLFERICATPEYYPTRTERGILEGHARDIAAATGPVELVELGSGSAEKTRLLFDAYGDRDGEVHFVPIDVSVDMLKDAGRRLVELHDGLNIRGFAGTYERALEALHPAPLPARMFLFLGSTIGNFSNPDRIAFLSRVFDAMDPGDFFLLGFDRLKDRAVLTAAYNDAAGLTARFNLNILDHLNARFDGNFRTDQFAHLAFFNEERSRIEMHLESRRDQAARLDALDLDVSLEAGETIHTEISRKFDPRMLADELVEIGFAPVTAWSDARQWFSLMLLARDTDAA